MKMFPNCKKKKIQNKNKMPIVWLQKISIPPPPKGFAVWPFLPSGFSKISPQRLPPLPSGISKIFAHPLEILQPPIEGNR